VDGHVTEEMNSLSEFWQVIIYLGVIVLLGCGFVAGIVFALDKKWRDIYNKEDED